MNDEHVWDSPREFRPTRFLKEGRVSTHPNWMPFGVGPRACPGQNFSMDTLMNITARIVRDYRLEFSRFLTPRKFAEEETTELVSLGLRKYRDYSVKVTRTDRARERIAMANNMMAAGA